MMPQPNSQAVESAQGFMARVAQMDVNLCPCCKVGRLQVTAVLRGQPRLPTPACAVAQQSRGGAARGAQDEQAKEQSSSARQAHWLKVALWQQQHRVAIATKVGIIRSNNRGETFPLSASVSAGGSVQQGLSVAGGVHGFYQHCSAADKR